MAKISLKAARVAANMTQDDMAAKLGISRSWIHKIEEGSEEVKPVYFYAWCQVTGFKSDDLFLPGEST